MKNIHAIIYMVLLTLMESCVGKEPTKNEILGRWISSDKAEITIVKDGKFSAKLIPAALIFIPASKYKDEHFSGVGNWNIRKGQSQWEVYLNFEKVSDKKYSCAFPLLIAGENGTLENSSPWYLFLWKGEEGEDRYIFTKVK